MRIIPRNTKVSTEFFKGVTLADMVVGFIGILIIFLIAVSSLPYRGYIAMGFGLVLLFLLVRIDDESNYMFFFRIIRHLSYFRRYRKAGFKYPEEIIKENEEYITESRNTEETDSVFASEQLSVDKTGSAEEIYIEEFNATTPETFSDVAGDILAYKEELQDSKKDQAKEKNPLFRELEEEGFEVLDLTDISMNKDEAKLPIDMLDGYEEKHRKVF